MPRLRFLATGSAILLAVGLGLVGCSGSAAPPAPPPPPAPGVAALDQAQAAMTSLRSYAFRLTATMAQDGATQRLGATGRVQTPDRIQAQVTVAGQGREVIGVPEGQFVLVPKGTWQRAQDTSLRPIPWPEVLGHLVSPVIAAAPAGGSTVTGSVPPADAATFGFPQGATLTSSRAVVTLDQRHQVTKLDLTLSGVQGTAPVEVTEQVELDGFDQQEPVGAPGGFV